MAELLGSGAPPESIAYFSGELIDDHHSLLLHVEEQLAAAPETGPNYLIVDEVTYIRDWDKAVKYAADAGLLERTVPIFISIRYLLRNFSPLKAG